MPRPSSTTSRITRSRSRRAETSMRPVGRLPAAIRWAAVSMPWSTALRRRWRIGSEIVEERPVDLDLGPRHHHVDLLAGAPRQVAGRAGEPVGEHGERGHARRHDPAVQVLGDGLEPVDPLLVGAAPRLGHGPAELAQPRGREQELAGDVEELVEHLRAHPYGADLLGAVLGTRRGPRCGDRRGLLDLPDPDAGQVGDLGQRPLQLGDWTGRCRARRRASAPASDRHAAPRRPGSRRRSIRLPRAASGPGTPARPAPGFPRRPPRPAAPGASCRGPGPPPAPETPRGIRAAPRLPAAGPRPPRADWPAPRARPAGHRPRPPAPSRRGRR